ncbi:MAG: sigma-70 family RNA polymerase sigma factor [Planctomycetaceae bacterium]
MSARDPNLEGDLIRRAQDGDQRAFESIARQHSEPLLRCALTLCRDRQVAEDISQETLVEAWTSIERFDGRCRFSTWLYGILRHRFLKAIRRVGQSPEELPPADAGPFLTTTTDPSLLAQRAEAANRIRQAVTDLPEEHRQVIELRFFADATLDDISVALDIPLGTVKSRLHNGLEKLRQQKFFVNLLTSSGESQVRKL